MPHKLLLVDDDKEIIQTLQARLIKEGYAVAVAFDGEEALLKVKEENPDLILLDLTMPKLNGFEVLKEIRKKYNDKWRPVIIISGKGDMESLKQSYGLEADHYLIKPCSIENILRSVETMISLIPLRADTKTVG
jgi:DNA-binding response OmpR family regulator